MAATPPSECAHCGLPLGRRPIAGAVDGVVHDFCCAGCWLAMQVTRASGESGGAATILVRLGLAVFFAMNVMMLSAPSYVPHVYGGGDAAVDGPLFAWLRWLSAAFSLPVLALLGGPVLRGALAGLRGGRAGSDALIAIGVAAAWLLSFANLVRGRATVYFDTAAMLLLLVTLGRYLEARARAEAGASVRANLAPGGCTARRVRGAGLDEVAVDDLVPGDVVEVSPGGAIPTDGVVLEGEAGVDESMLTGESRLVAKEPGAAVAGGTCSVDGRLRIRVTASAAESATARIEALLVAARRERSRAERVADAAAAVITPVLLAVAAGAGAWWAMHEGTERGVLVAIAVLVVACPCGLGIATPVAVWMGLRTAARRGIVVRSAPALERLADVRSVLFDKTGTVTEPQASLVGVVRAPGAAIDEPALVARCAALEAGIAHPLARAIAAAAGQPGGAALVPGEVRIVPGRGVAGIVGGRRLVVGSTRLAEAELDPQGRRDLAALAARVASGPTAVGEERGGCAAAAEPPASCAFVVENGRLLGGLLFAEALRPGVAAAMAALRASGAEVGLLTGDVSAAAVVPGVFRADEVVAGLSPAGKVEHLRRLRSATPAGPPIAMVGDGINDAPALAGADVGIAVAGATDLARLTADVAILTGDLGAVPWLLAQARRVRAVARQNLVWAFGYNLVAVGLAAAGRLTPLVASLAMIASSLAVVANARRLGAEARRERSRRSDAGLEIPLGGRAPGAAAAPASSPAPVPVAATPRLGVASQPLGSNSSAAELMQ